MAMGMSEPKVSVIICCYTEKRLKDIHEVVESVLAQTLKPREVIIAVDHNKQLYERLAETYRNSVKIHRNSVNLNQSPDCQSPAPNPQPPVPIVLVLNEGAQGLSETRNVGIRAASGDIVAFIDDDALAEPDWLGNLIRPFQLPIPNPQSHVVAVGGQAIPLWPNDKRPSWFAEELDWIVGCTYKGLPLDGNRIRNVAGCNMAFRKEVFERVGFFRSDIGGLKETPRGGEEAELCLRISRALPEALIIYKKQATIHHTVTPRRTTWRYLWQRSYNEGFYKAKVQKLRQPTQQTLSTEDSYLRYLMFKSIPERLRGFYKKGKLLQVGAIIITITATGVGYILGRMRSHD